MPVHCRDYRENELLDQYEESGLADEEAAGEEDVTLEEVMERRRLAEREMGKRDRREGRHVLPGALDGGLQQPANLSVCATQRALSCSSASHNGTSMAAVSGSMCCWGS